MSLEELRRAKFEAWVKSEVGDELSVLYRRDAPGSERLGQYVNESVESFWIGYNAALDGAAIDLSTLRVTSRPGFTGSERVYVSDVTEICEAAGLKVIP